MIDPSEDRARIRRDLGAIVETVSIEPREPSPSEPTVSGTKTTHLHGAMRFAPSLVGPPGRLHGGLHAYARVLPVLRAIPAHDPKGTYPCRLELGLYRPLPLDESVPFRATHTATASSFVLEVDHAENGKLHTVARSVRGANPDAALDWFREAYARTRDAAPERTIKAQGDIPMDVFRDLVVMPVSRAMRTGGAPTYARFANADGSLDASAICVGLDLLAAVTAGYAWQSHIFTTRIDLVLETGHIGSDVELLMLASRITAPDPECHVRPVPLGEGRGEGGPTKVRVLLTDERVGRAYAHGTFTLVPARS